jgi:hypothetical protein
MVAELDRQVEIETARLFPPALPPVPTGKREWDRQATALIKLYPGEPWKVAAHLNWLMQLPTGDEAAWDQELLQVAVRSELARYLGDLWRHVKAAGTAGWLQFSYQPTDPAAARVILLADRCPFLTVLSPGTLFEGELAVAIHCGLRNPAMPDTLRLDGHELWHARIAQMPLVEKGKTKPAARSPRQHKAQIDDTKIHAVIADMIAEALPMTVNRPKAREAVWARHAAARQEDIDRCFRDKRYDKLVRRRLADR